MPSGLLRAADAPAEPTVQVEVPLEFLGDADAPTTDPFRTPSDGTVRVAPATMPVPARTGDRDWVGFGTLPPRAPPAVPKGPLPDPELEAYGPTKPSAPRGEVTRQGPIPEIDEHVPPTLPLDEAVTLPPVPQAPAPVPPVCAQCGAPKRAGPDAPCEFCAGAPSPSAPAAASAELRARPAALWRRLGALTLDLLVLTSGMGLFLAVGSLASSVDLSHASIKSLDGVMVGLHAMHRLLLPAALFGLIAGTVYCIAGAALMRGRTLGRLAFGLRLVDATGRPPSPTRAVVRAALAVASFGLFLMGYWLALVDPKGQTLHDKLTRTFVVRPLI